jgi:hypothetical protein
VMYLRRVMRLSSLVSFFFFMEFRLFLNYSFFTIFSFLFRWYYRLWWTWLFVFQGQDRWYIQVSVYLLIKCTSTIRHLL